MRHIRGTTVAVVGGAGFLGSHLVNHLIEDRGCEVMVLDNLCVGRREFIHPKARFVHCDITQGEEHLRHLFCNVKYVFNYAASPYVPDSYRRPIHVANVNFFGAMKVINAAQEAGCKAILQVSSAEVYGGDSIKYAEIAPTEKMNEASRVTPHSSYGASKAAVDAYCQVTWRERQTPVIALRQFNCIGARETHPYVTTEIISQLSRSGEAMKRYNDAQLPSNPDKPIFTAKRPVVLLGNNSFRDFMAAKDAVRIAVELLERGEFGEVYNLGSESGLKVYDLAKLVGKVMGFADVRVEEDASRKRAWEIWHLQSDNSKLWKVIDLPDRDILVPTPLEDSIREVVEWYHGNGSKWPWEK